MPAQKTGQAKASTNGHRVIDLDKAKAARAEVDRQAVAIKFAGEVFELSPELPAEFSLLAEEGRNRAALIALFGEDESERFLALRPTVEDLNELLQQVFGLYGTDEGE